MRSIEKVPRGENHYKWKGDAVQRGQAHAYVKKELLKILPLACTKCGSTKNIDLASINGHHYTRNLADYTFLCKRCHNEMDGLFNNLAQGIDAIYNSPRYNPDTAEKTCSVCGRLKPLQDFYINGDTQRSECKDCTKQIHITRYRNSHPGTPLLRLQLELQRGVRTCRKCKTIKPLSEFHKRNSKGGTTSFCKDCIRKNAREKYHQNKHLAGFKRENVAWICPRCKITFYKDCRQGLSLARRNHERICKT